MAYLILRAVGTLTPAEQSRPTARLPTRSSPPTPATGPSEGVSGGAYGKVIRWSFEKQNAATRRRRPARRVDVYIDDGRGGEYQYQPVLWNTTTIWNRRAPTA